MEGDAGIESSVRGAAAIALGAVSTRLELLGSEFEEDRAWLARIVLVAVAAAFCLGVGLVLVALFIVMAVDPADRLLALGTIAFAFAGAAAGLALWVAAMTRRKPRLFSASAAELKLDAERIRPTAAS